MAPNTWRASSAWCVFAAHTFGLILIANASEEERVAVESRAAVTTTVTAQAFAVDSR